MRTATAHERHRAHHIRLLAGLLAIAVSGTACSRSLPRPPATRVDSADYIAVPFTPRVPPVEFVPPPPSSKAVWVDGSWEWVNGRYGWRYGSWVVPPPDARHARWTVVRRKEDGQLFFAPSSWKDAAGKPIDDRSFARALGPAARARTRPGAPPPARELEQAGVPEGQRRGPSEVETPAGAPAEVDMDTGDVEREGD